MICGVLGLENTVQIGDKTRLDASNSFISKGEQAITMVEILPEIGGSYIDVTGSAPSDWWTDWIYTGASRVVTVTLRITTDPTGPTQSSFTQAVNIVSAADDMLFSGDQDLTTLEPDVMKWIPDGRASWLNIHRSAQDKILDWLNKSGVQDSDGNAYAKADILDVDEVKFWSRDWVLALIFQGAQNVVGDVFSEKAKFYFAEATKGADRAFLRLDVNHDGTIGKNEQINMTSRDLVRE